jgi:hypothetical protein
MNMTTKALGCLAAVLFAMFLAGCDTNPVRRVPFKVPVVAWTDDGDYLPKRVGPGLVAMENSPIPDVPMPIGFKPVRSECSSSFDGMSRTVSHVYQGRARAAEVVLFYSQQLSLHGWQRVEKQNHDDNSTSLHYTKGAESLGIRFSDRHGTTTIEVYLSPR